MSASDPIEQLRERCDKALKIQWESKARLHPVRQEIDSIRQGRKGVNKEAKNSLQAYAKSSCRTLSDQVYAAFPREIRDVIYGYLLPSDPNVSPNKILSELYLGDDIYRWCPGRSISLKEPGYFSSDMTKEILDVLIRTRKWCFRRDDLHDISEFRVTDSLGVGIIPADYVLDVEIFTDCSKYAFEGLLRLQGREDGWGMYGIRPKVKLLAGLECLFGFKKGTKLTLDFLIMIDDLEPTLQANSHEWLCDVVMPHVHRSLIRLEDAGYKVAIRLRAWQLGGFIFRTGFLFNDCDYKINEIKATAAKNESHDRAHELGSADDGDEEDGSESGDD